WATMKEDVVLQPHILESKKRNWMITMIRKKKIAGVLASSLILDDDDGEGED
ncbi:hypothetical protein TorRG33x02_357370, partial [Trema orientale]